MHPYITSDGIKEIVRVDILVIPNIQVDWITGYPPVVIGYILQM